MAAPIMRTYVNWHGDREPRTAARAVRSSMSDRVAAVRGSVPVTEVFETLHQAVCHLGFQDLENVYRNCRWPVVRIKVCTACSATPESR